MDELEKFRNQIDDVDSSMAKLFQKRMEISDRIARYKRQNNLPILNSEREKEVIKKNSVYVEDKYKNLYGDFQNKIMDISKSYQYDMIKDINIKTVHLGKTTYDVIVERKGIDKLHKYFDIKRKVLILTDSGVPEIYSETVASFCRIYHIYTVEKGEKSKCFEKYKDILKFMLENEFTRNDCVVAVGGGVVGDLAGFVAATYMRGIDFYNIPTTLLSQVDSSVGGKTGIDFDGVKNSVGAFYQPKKVLIDPSLLETLDNSELSNGFAEIVKMAATFDSELFEFMESRDVLENIDSVISRCVNIKIKVVESDEKESGLRRALNFGHTLGHAIEAEYGLSHGQSVALGMLPMCSDEAFIRIKAMLGMFLLDTDFEYDIDLLKDRIKHDKKNSGDGLQTVYVDKIGSFKFENLKLEEFTERVNNFKRKVL